MRFFNSLILILCFSGQLVFAQNDYLKNDTSVYVTDISKLPKVKREWKSYIKDRSIPLKSIESSDFNDLMFLHSILKDKQYVFLGESSHSCKEFSQIKYRLVKFLTQEMEFQVVAFESNLWDCYNIDIQKGELDAKQILIRSIYGVWHTETVLEIMKYLKDQNLSLAGFDVKESGLADYYFEKNILNEFSSSVAGKSIESLQNYYEFRNLYLRNNGYVDEELYSIGKEMITALMMVHDSIAELKKKHPTDNSLKVYCKDIGNKIQYVEWLLQERQYTEMISVKRDSLMATTFTWLAKNIFPNKKIIVWAHNAHISNCSTQGIRRMGSWFHDTIKQKSYTIGLYMYRGEVYANKKIKIAKPHKNSLEAIMVQPRYKYSFIDFSNITKKRENSWLFNKTPTLYWGLTKEKLRLKDTYSGLIFIDSVSPPNYMFDYLKNR